MVAGISGGLSSLLVKKAFDKKYMAKAGRIFRSYKNKLNYDINTQMYNPRTNFDLFCFSRGLIAGSIIVSAPASDYKIWISIILGAIGGAIVVASS